jgi:omega-6 fatty acid desaturase (delta-12 desaturase)
MLAVAEHKKPVLRRSVWQLANSLVPYLALWGLMIWSLGVSYWITLGLAVVAAGFLLRVFIIFHDCGHGSFFKSRRANRVTEFLTGLLVFTPYRQWSHTHARHHATSGDLDRRGPGEIWTLTVQEYLEASRWKRLAYRLGRNPVVLFVIAPSLVFLIQQRLPSRALGPRERRGVHWTNLALLAITATMSHLLSHDEDSLGAALDAGPGATGAVNQDNWALPAVENCLFDAEHFAGRIARELRSRP